MKPNIFINGRFLTQKLTGVQRYAIEISIRLIEYDPSIIILIPEGTHSIPEQLKSNIKIIKFLKSHAWEQITLPVFLYSQPSYFLINLCNLAPIILKHQLTIIHDIAFTKNEQWFSLLFRIFYQLLMPLIIYSSKAIGTVSNFSAEEISNYYHIKKHSIGVFPNAISPHFIKLGKVQDNHRSRPYFLCVGSIDPRKNLSIVIDAFYSLPNDDYDLIICGSKHTIFGNSTSTTSSDKIIFTGYLSDLELKLLYKHAFCFIFASKYEGFGLPPLEALAFNIPLIVSKIPVHLEVLEDIPIYFDPTNKGELVEKMNDMIINEKKNHISRDNIRILNKYSWDKSATSFIQFVYKVISS